METTGTAEHISCVDTAKIIRKALATAFPGVKFSVRSSVYSGGASIDVSWIDGPNRDAVESIVKHFGGADFDGMIDLKTYHDTVLVGPNGPRLVAFGADFVFTHRRESQFEELKAQALEIIKARCVVEREQFGGDWIDNLAARMVWAIDFTKGETVENTFRRVVLREAP